MTILVNYDHKNFNRIGPWAEFSTLDVCRRIYALKGPNLKLKIQKKLTKWNEIITNILDLLKYIFKTMEMVKG